MKIRPSTRNDIRGMLAVAKMRPAWPQLAAIELYYEHGFVAVEGNRIIGFITCSHEDGIPLVTNLRIDPARGRQGIGSKLIAAVLKEADKLGATSVRVLVMGWTRPFNRMYAETRLFYQALGFKVVKKHPVIKEGGDQWRYYTLEKKCAEPDHSKKRT
jgi:ribosomal protein S18 acetylase RimI-like enzyme